MIKVGITGIGFMGMMHYLAYQKVPGVKVTALCEKVFTERLQGDWTKIKGNFGPQGAKVDLTGVATFTDLDAMLAKGDVDMVDVCLPPADHAAATIAALNAGKHTLCEKPISLKVDQADAMVAAAKKNNKLLMIGHVLPFFPGHAFVWDAVKSGRYGRLLGGHFNRVISTPTWMPEERFYDMDKVGGPLLDLHIHDAHFIRILFGMPKQVQSVGRCYGDVPKYFSTLFTFDDPSLVVTAVSGVIDQQGRPFTHGYEIHFEKATLIHDSFMGMMPTVLTADGKVEKPTLPGGDEVATFAAEMAEVANAVSTGKASAMLDGTLARDALVICHSEMESVRTRKTVAV
ncbi:MAG: Gfo/Idh/MocA family protein [Thermoguttaceae bacterium]